MGKFLAILQLAMSFLPWIQTAEDMFGSGNGEKKKQFILDALEAGGGALITRFGVPPSHVAEFMALAGPAIDLGVNLAHFKGIFKADTSKMNQTHAALSMAPPVAPFTIAGQAGQ
jgi:hypothetical protein